MAEDTTKKTAAPTKKKVKKTRKKVNLTNDQLKEVIESIQAGEKGKTLKTKYGLNDGILYKIKKELKMSRKVKNDESPLPENYFSPINIQNRVDNILFDMGYTK